MLGVFHYYSSFLILTRIPQSINDMITVSDMEHSQRVLIILIILIAQLVGPGLEPSSTWIQSQYALNYTRRKCESIFSILLWDAGELFITIII